MDYIENFIKELPEMKSGEELIEELSIFPDYNDSIRQESQTVRLMRLSDLYRLYVPSNMSTEIYAKLYLALLRSLQKKGTQAAIRQKYQNYNRIQNMIAQFPSFYPDELVYSILARYYFPSVPTLTLESSYFTDLISLLSNVTEKSGDFVLFNGR